MKERTEAPDVQAEVKMKRMNGVTSRSESTDIATQSLTSPPARAAGALRVLLVFRC